MRKSKPIRSNPTHGLDDRYTYLIYIGINPDKKPYLDVRDPQGLLTLRLLHKRKLRTLAHRILKAIGDER